MVREISKPSLVIAHGSVFIKECSSLFELPSSLDSHRAHRNTATRPEYDQSKESCSIYLLTRSIVESQSRGD